MFSVESMFRINSVVSNQNMRIWGVKRPDELNVVVMKSPRDMTWWAIRKDRDVCPCVFENENVTSESYQKILIYLEFPNLGLLLEEYIFCRAVLLPYALINISISHLTNQRSNRWIQRGGPFFGQRLPTV